jgi:cyclic beta-1,2-glucan synthetase
VVGDPPADAREPTSTSCTSCPRRRSSARSDDGIETQLEIAVSPEDDVEVRRLSLSNRDDRVREIEITSYAEIVLGDRGDRPRASRLRQALHRDRVLSEHTALLCRRRPRASSEPVVIAIHTLSVEGGLRGPRRMGDRPGGVSRPRPRPELRRIAARRTAALGPRRRGPRSGREPALPGPPRARRLRAPELHDRRRRRRPGGARARAEVPRLRDRQSHDGARLHPRADRAPPPRARSDEAQLFERLASRVFGPIPTLRADPALRADNTRGQSGLWQFGISGDLPIVVVIVVESDDMPLVQQVLQAQEYWRMKGLASGRRDLERARRGLSQ